MTRLNADLLLALCAFIWGTAFVAQKDLHAVAWPGLFVCIRFSLSALLLAPLALREARRDGGAHPARPRQWALAIGIGLCLSVAATMQQVAITMTTATNGGFLTAVYVAFVPFAVWLIAGTPPRLGVLGACSVTVAGAWLLAGGSLRGWGRGDVILLATDLVWSLHITLIARFLGQLNRPYLLCFMQFAVTALGSGVYALLAEHAEPADIAAALPSLLYAGIASGGIAYTLQIVAQRYAPAAEAALIMSLESVFAAIAGAVVLHERLTPIATLGCLLILAGAVMVELAPALRRGLLKVLGKN
jgi:drug/metabolite transporter (DMT)-like permease